MNGDPMNVHAFIGMDQGHYICDVLDYSNGTWWKCDDEIVTKYPGYPTNVYNEVSSDKKQKKGERHNMDRSESIVSVIYIRKDILIVRTYSFITGMSKKKYGTYFGEKS